MTGDTSDKKYGPGHPRIPDRKQIDGESPETQRKTIQEYADRNNIEIIDWFHDEARTGKNTEREALQEMLKFAIKNSKKIDFIIFYKMNRASRDLGSYFTQVKALLAGKGISVRSATEPVDDTPIGRFMEGLFVLNGQLDNEVKSSATTDNMRSLAMQGYWQHGPVLGYDKQVIHNEAGKPRPTMKPNAMADKVRQVLERYAEGDINPMELMRYANSIGLRTPGYTKKDGTRVPPSKLGKSSIYRLIRRPEYAGFVHDKFTNNQLVEGKHEPIISKELFEHNQVLVDGKKRTKSTYTKANADYPLKGTLLCIDCNYPMYASAPKTGGGKSHSPRYHCYRPNCPGTHQRSVGTQEAHQAFHLLMKDMQPSEGLIRLYKEVLIRQAAKENGRANTQVKVKREELDRIANTRLAAIEDRVAAVEAQQKQELSDLINHLDQRKLEVTCELDELLEQQTIQEAKIEYALNTMHDIARQWQDAAYDLKQRFQSMMFPEGLVLNIDTMEFGTTEISPLYRYAPIKKDLSVKEKSLLVIPAGVEPAIFWMRTKCPGPLDDGTSSELTPLLPF